ncbi:hypothetical protein WA026_001853 [Henosepilachna vigintioctopunctata]|uniref:Reverse transcriptase domain-containing protein n=1 Tax=Henosepilachna vigintioctopunctata TaxID=420089 RepID=A0AAW1UUL5_9CUCU
MTLDSLPFSHQHYEINQLKAYFSGFILERSVTTNLLIFVDIIKEAMKAGKQIDTIYSDFKKVFDIVPLWFINAEIEALEIGPPLKDWLADGSYEY